MDAIQPKVTRRTYSETMEKITTGHSLFLMEIDPLHLRIGPATEAKQSKNWEYGQTFRKGSQLTSCNWIHTGEKPYKCMECGKSFKRNKYLTIHKRIHMGGKPYQCTGCGKNFAYFSELATREIIQEKPYKCRECGKSFKTRKYLTKHKSIHTEKKLLSWSVERTSGCSIKLLYITGPTQGRSHINARNVERAFLIPVNLLNMK